MRLAQSTKSKHFHFKSKLCKICNGSATQNPDRAFSRFHTLAKRSLISGDVREWKDDIFLPEEFALGSEASSNLFRYFSKTLCCRLAESEGPTPIYLAQHAIGNFTQNRVWLQVRRDPQHQRFEKTFGHWPYAAHGGLIVYAQKAGGAPQAFHSTISIGPVQYIFWFRLHWIEKIELKFFHTNFFNFCVEATKNREILPTDLNKLEELGLH